MIRRLMVMVFLIGLGVLFGCAGSTPPASFKKELSDSMRLCKLDEAKVRLTKAETIEMDSVALQRLESRLQNAVDTARSKVVCATDVKRTYVLDGKIIRYDAGNAFARAMLAGLGQIHIDGEFVLSMVLPAAEQVAEFTISKTFAWGGLYGGTTRIEDVEPAFCEGVAKTIVKE
jgi:hypothetical protein